MASTPAGSSSPAYHASSAAYHDEPSCKSGLSLGNSEQWVLAYSTGAPRVGNGRCEGPGGPRKGRGPGRSAGRRPGLACRTRTPHEPLPDHWWVGCPTHTRDLGALWRLMVPPHPAAPPRTSPAAITSTAPWLRAVVAWSSMDASLIFEGSLSGLESSTACPVACLSGLESSTA